MVLFCHVIQQDHMMKRPCIDIQVRVHHDKLSPCQVWWPQALQQERYNGFKALNDFLVTLQGESPSFQVWWGQALQQCIYNSFSLSHDLARPRDQRDMSFYGWGDPHGKPPAKFDGCRHCGSEDMMFAVVEAQDSICPRLDPPLLFIAEANDMQCLHARNSRMQDSRSQSQMSTRTTYKVFASPPKYNARNKKKEKKECQL